MAYDPPLVVAISKEEYAERRDRLGALLEERGIDALFVPPFVRPRVGERRLDSGGPTKLDSLREGEVVLFDFGAVVDGYCSDFGRTIPCGEPPPRYEEARGAMLEAQEAAGRRPSPVSSRAT
jgi:Metallopeptidase family M24